MSIKNTWPYLLSLLILVATGGFIAHLRLSPIPDLAIGHSSPNPELGQYREKTVEYEVTGSDGAAVTVSYLDVNAQARDVTAVVPWRITLRDRALTVPAGVLAQTNAARLGCRIVIDGVVRDARSAEGPAAAVNCNVQVG